MKNVSHLFHKSENLLQNFENCIFLTAESSAINKNGYTRAYACAHPQKPLALVVDFFARTFQWLYFRTFKSTSISLEDFELIFEKTNYSSYFIL